MPPVKVFEPEYIPVKFDAEEDRQTSYKVQNGVYYIEGPWLERLMGSVNISDYESRMYFQRVLLKAGGF